MKTTMMKRNQMMMSRLIRIQEADNRKEMEELSRLKKILMRRMKMMIVTSRTMKRKKVKMRTMNPTLMKTRNQHLFTTDSQAVNI